MMTIALALLLGGVQDPAGAAADSSTTDKCRIPKFIMNAFASPHAIRGKLYVAKDGTIDRSKVYLKKEGVPGWTHVLADERLGKGEDLSFEAEVYADGTEVYEISRRIDGKPRKISIRLDKKVRYVESTLDRASVPASVSTAVTKLEGFQADDWRRRDGENIAEIHVRGTVGGVPHRARFRVDGTLMSVEKHLPAELEVAITSILEPAAK